MPQCGRHRQMPHQKPPAGSGGYGACARRREREATCAGKEQGGKLGEETEWQRAFDKPGSAGQESQEKEQEQEPEEEQKHGQSEG